MDAVKEVVDTTSIDDNPVLTAYVTEEGCVAHVNTRKPTSHTSNLNAFEVAFLVTHSSLGGVALSLSMMT